jgi:ABC-type sulfate/molybdate transport systems ATPase subunit
MSILVENISKTFGSFHALDRVNLEIKNKFYLSLSAKCLIKYLNRKYAVMVNSGSSANLLAINSFFYV